MIKKNKGVEEAEFPPTAYSNKTRRIQTLFQAYYNPILPRGSQNESPLLQYSSRKKSLSQLPETKKNDKVLKESGSFSKASRGLTKDLSNMTVTSKSVNIHKGQIDS